MGSFHKLKINQGTQAMKMREDHANNEMKTQQNIRYS